MQNTEFKGRTLLKVTGVIFIVLSALGFLASLLLIAVGLVTGTDDGMAWGAVTAIIVLGTLAVPSSLFGLAGTMARLYITKPFEYGFVFPCLMESR